MTELNTLMNIGKEMQRKLITIDIKDANELKAMGAKEAFLKLKLAYPEVCLVHLYSLYGAIENIAYNNLPEEVKVDLKNYCDSIK